MRAEITLDISQGLPDVAARLDPPSHSELHQPLSLADVVALLRVPECVPCGRAGGVAVLPKCGKGGDHLGGGEVEGVLDPLEDRIASRMNVEVVDA